MAVIFRFLNSILAVLAVIACLAAVGIIVYSIVRPDMSGIIDIITPDDEPTDPGEIPSPIEPEADASPSAAEHDYVSEVYVEPTCTVDGQMIFMRDDGEDIYYESIPATGHYPSEWQLTVAPTSTTPGIRVITCTECGEVLIHEVLPATGPSPDPSATPIPSPSPHVHDYTATTTREPTCTVAGIRRYSCSCGSYYQENIRALGHFAADWVVVVQPTTEKTGIRQRLCNVCHSVIDSQPVPKQVPGPSPSESPEPSPSPSPHTHNFVSYISLVPTCSQRGARTYDCSGCGADYSEPIPIDPENHDYGPDGVCRYNPNHHQAASASPSP